MAKKKKLLKKLAKAALIGGALYGGSKLLKNRKAKSIADMDDAGLGVSHFKNAITKKAAPKMFDHNKVFGDVSKGDYGVGFRGGGLATRGMGQALKRGGRVKSMGIAKRGGGAAKR